MCVSPCVHYACESHSTGRRGEGNWNVRANDILTGALLQVFEGLLNRLRLGLRQRDEVEPRASGAGDLRRFCGCPLVAKWSACRSIHRLGW